MPACPVLLPLGNQAVLKRVDGVGALFCTVATRAAVFDVTVSHIQERVIRILIWLYQVRILVVSVFSGNLFGVRPAEVELNFKIKQTEEVIL